MKYQEAANGSSPILNTHYTRQNFTLEKICNKHLAIKEKKANK